MKAWWILLFTLGCMGIDGNLVKLRFHPNPVTEGQQVTISCECDQYPVDQWTIYYKNFSKLIASSEGHGNSHNFQTNITTSKDMNGTYICAANSEYQIKLLQTNITTNMLHVAGSTRSENPSTRIQMSNYAEESLTIYSQVKLVKDGEVYTSADSISLQEGANMTLTCVQQGHPHITWEVRVNNISYTKYDDRENGVTIRNATVTDSGSYRCTSSFGSQREIKVAVGNCQPRIEFTRTNKQGNGRKYRVDGISFTIRCSADEQDRDCNLKLGSEYNFNQAPVKTEGNNTISWTYELDLLSMIHMNQQFWCSASTPSGFELYRVDKEVEHPTFHETGYSFETVLVLFMICSLLAIAFSNLVYLLFACAAHAYFVYKRPDLEAARERFENPPQFNQQVRYFRRRNRPRYGYHFDSDFGSDSDETASTDALPSDFDETNNTNEDSQIETTITPHESDSVIGEEISNLRKVDEKEDLQIETTITPHESDSVIGEEISNLRKVDEKEDPQIETTITPHESDSEIGGEISNPAEQEEQETRV